MRIITSSVVRVVRRASPLRTRLVIQETGCDYVISLEIVEVGKWQNVRRFRLPPVPRQHGSLAPVLHGETARKVTIPGS